MNKPKKDKWIAIFQLIKLSTQYIHFHFKENRIFVQGMNKSHSSLFELNIDYEWLDYIEKDTFFFSIESSIFCSILSIPSENQFILFEYIPNNEKLFISFINNKEIKTYLPDSCCSESSLYNKFFEITLIEMEYDLLDIPVLEYDAEFSICPKIWGDLLSQMSIFSDKLHIKCNEDLIELKALGDQNEMKIDIPIQNIEEYSINEGEEITMMFHLSLLSKFCLTTKISNFISIHFKKEFPLQVKYIFDENELVFYISYMIDSD